MKFKELAKMKKEEREKKLKELKMELIKAQSSKTAGSKAKNIRKIIARIHTLNNSKEALKKN